MVNENVRFRRYLENVLEETVDWNFRKRSSILWDNFISYPLSILLLYYTVSTCTDRKLPTFVLNTIIIICINCTINILY